MTEKRPETINQSQTARVRPPEPGDIIPPASYQVYPTTEIGKMANSPQLNEGWVRPKPEILPRPTYWPVIMALAITLFGLGIISSILILAIGVVLFIVSLIGWIGDIRNELREEQEHQHHS